MNGISKKLGTKTRIFAAAAAAAAAVGLTACSAAGGAPAPTVTKTVTQHAPATQAAVASDSKAKAHHASAEASGAAPAAAEKSARGKLPKYRPSALVSKTAYSTVLTSPDSVSKIGAFYRKALAAGGWHVVSDSASPYHASFSADRGNKGVSISVYPRAGGSGISISTHPR
jgi:hypothetical protein